MNVNMDVVIENIKNEPEDPDLINSELVKTIKIEPSELEQIIDNLKAEDLQDPLDTQDPLPIVIKNEDYKVESDSSTIFDFNYTEKNESKNSKGPQKNTEKSKSDKKIKPAIHKCNECDFAGKTKQCLTRHVTIHTGERPYPCHLCPYRARLKVSLDHHIKVHNGDLKFICPTCNKAFISKRNLSEHVRIHSEEKPYECYHCHTKCRYKQNLISHIRQLHNIGIDLNKPPKIKETEPCGICYICGKRLMRRSSLIGHLRAHSGVKSHLCEICGKHFREKSILKNHLKTHTSVKQFKCEDCDYNTNRKDLLQEHAKSHVRNRGLVECADCGKRYTTKLLLKHHYLEEHADEDEKRDLT